MSCSSSEDLYGEPFPEDKENKELKLVILFMDDNSETYTCYTTNEFNDILKTSINVPERDLICIQKGNTSAKFLFEPVIKEAFTGVWIDKSVLAYQNSNKFFVYKRGIFPLRSAFGMSALHGAPNVVYSVLPIDREDFFDIPLSQVKREAKEYIERTGKDVLEKKIINKLLVARKVWVDGDGFQKIYNPNEEVKEYVEEKEEEHEQLNQNENENAINQNQADSGSEFDEFDYHSDSESEADEPSFTLRGDDSVEIPLEIFTRNIKELIVWGCPNLTSIPNIPGLQELICRDCPQLRTISNIEDLLELSIENCPITSIPNIAGLEILSCDTTELSEIPNITGLRNLTCDRSNIREIPNIQRLKKLECSDNRLLETIPNIIGLRTLYCSYCPVLTRIPDIAGLKNLNCGNCSSLTYIPVIAGLENLNCSNCPLATVPRIRGLEMIDCNGTPGCYEL